MLKSLFYNILSFFYKRVEDLKEQCRLKDLREMLMDYGLRNVNVADALNAEVIPYKYIDASFLGFAGNSASSKIN